MRSSRPSDLSGRSYSSSLLTRTHPFFPQFVKLMRAVAAHPPVYDLGANRRFAKESDLVRDLFDEKSYFAGGFNPHRSVARDACDFHCDLHDLKNISNGSAGAAVCLEVLEHVHDPWKAIKEVHRILAERPMCSGRPLFVCVPREVEAQLQSGFSAEHDA